MSGIDIRENSDINQNSDYLNYKNCSRFNQKILFRPFSNYSLKKYRCEFNTRSVHIILIILISITFYLHQNRYSSKQILICDVITLLNARFFSF